MEREDDGVRIAEDAMNASGGAKPREGVEVAQLGEVGHARIVTSFWSGVK